MSVYFFPFRVKGSLIVVVVLFRGGGARVVRVLVVTVVVLLATAPEPSHAAVACFARERERVASVASSPRLYVCMYKRNPLPPAAGTRDGIRMAWQSQSAANKEKRGCPLRDPKCLWRFTLPSVVLGETMPGALHAPGSEESRLRSMLCKFFPPYLRLSLLETNTVDVCLGKVASEPVGK